VCVCLERALAPQGGPLPATHRLTSIRTTQLAKTLGYNLPKSTGVIGIQLQTLRRERRGALWVGTVNSLTAC